MVYKRQNIKKITAVILAAIVGLAFMPAFTADAFAASSLPDDPQAPAAASSASKTTSAVTTKAVSSPTMPAQFSGYTVYYGPDISQWNSSTTTYLTDAQWAKIKAAGYKYAIIRVGYRGTSTGSLNADNGYVQNIKSARAAGLKVGVYFFSQALSVSEARAEANKTLELIEPYKSYIDLPVVMDYEYYSGGRLTTSKPSAAVKTQAVNAFFGVIEDAGYTPMLYASRSFLENSLNAADIDSSGEIWLAQWASSTSYSGPFSFWQWTDSGKISGFSGKVFDLNAWYTKDVHQYDMSYEKQKPTGLSQSARTGTSVTLTWTAARKADSYTIYRSDTYTGTFVKVGTSTGTSFKNTGLTPGREYYYKITASGTDYTGTTVTSGKTSGYSRAYSTVPYKTVVTLQETADLYKRPNTTTLTSIAGGTKLTGITKSKDNNGEYWYRVAYTSGGTTYNGYLKASNLTLTRTGTTKQKVNLRKSATTSSTKILTLAKGVTVTIRGTKADSAGDTWYKVTYKKSSSKTYKGYVFGNYIK